MAASWTRRVVFFGAVALGVALSGPLWAQGPGAELAVRPPHPSGPAGSRQAMWPGFKMLPDGRSVVFVKTGREPEITQQRQKGQLDVVLGGLRVPPGNPQRPLDTHFFPTPVTRVQLVKHRGGVVLRLSLRAPVEPTIGTQDLGDGFYFVTLTFPAGDAT